MGYSLWGSRESDMTERLSTQAYTHTHVYIHIVLQVCVASLVAQTVKHLPAMWETQVQSLGLEDPLEKEMATHSSILAWRIPWTEEPGGLQSGES